MNTDTGKIDSTAPVATQTGAASASTAPTASPRFVRETGLAGQLAAIVEPVLEGLGFRLVRVKISGQEGQTVQIMAERPDGSMTIEDCESISRDLSAVLDTLDARAGDPLPGAYRLEVSSPGIDRPLVRASDFEDWQGHEVRLELKEAISGRKRWRGEIEGLVEGEARIVCEIEGLGLQTVGFPVTMLAEAKLVLTDDLVRDALRASKGKAPIPENEFPAGKKPRRAAKGNSKPGRRGNPAPAADDMSED